MIEPEPLQQVERTFVRWGKQKLSYFAGCDYFRLASHPRVLAAVETGIRKFGLNVAASRMTTGNHELYGRLEQALSKFFAAEAAVLLSSGYMTNLAVAQALVREFTHALIDEKAHPSLLDAAQFLRCPLIKFKHRDSADLARALKQCGKSARLLLLTEGMFAQDGAIAPLREYLRVLPRNAWLMVDDAHGGGVAGKTGKGAIEAENISRGRVVQTVTLSKAFGTYGGAVLCSRAVRKKILATPLFAGQTPLPLPLASGALESINILKRSHALRRRLLLNAEYVKTALLEAGFSIGGNLNPILNVVPANACEAAAVKRALLAHHVFPSFIKYPGGPAQGWFRFVISSEHSREQLDALVHALLSVAPQKV